MSLYEGTLNATGKSFAIVASRFNDLVVAELVRGAKGMLVSVGARDEDIAVYRVPGAFEIPPVASQLARRANYDAIICLGVVIRGGTPHFDYVAGEASKGIAQVARESDIPVVFGLLTTDTLEQALERAGSKQRNKGAEAAAAAVEMANLYDKIKE